MIAQVAGHLVAKDIDRVEVMTEGGVAYDIAIPLGVFEALPRVGEKVALHTHLVVKEDGWQLFGFANVYERRTFTKVLGAKGIGPSLALSLLSVLSAERLVAALRAKDIATLQSVKGVGRKKAEQLVLDLADKLDDLAREPAGAGVRPAGAGVDDAIRALQSLGYTPVDAEKAVRGALDAGAPSSAPELIRASLARIGGRG
ncbi:MAG: Holliday junction branch migration protein RuvA [Gemmatimonadetes bacterium]|nr:Holliday junction branch migration protein RuvA [Gemmatimonadota bacterium]